MLKQLSATRGLPASLIAVGVLALSACSSSNDSRVVGPTPPPPTPTASVTPSPTVTTSPSPSPTVTTSPSPSPVADLRVLGIRGSNELIEFSAASPFDVKVLGAVPMVDLDDGERVIGLDTRPSDGALIAVTSDRKVLRLDGFDGESPLTAQALQSLTAPANIFFGDYGIDFNPVVPAPTPGALRLISDFGENFRVLPAALVDTPPAAVVATVRDGDIGYAVTGLTALARVSINFGAAFEPSLYVLDTSVGGGRLLATDTFFASSSESPAPTSEQTAARRAALTVQGTLRPSVEVIQPDNGFTVVDIGGDEEGWAVLSTTNANGIFSSGIYAIALNPFSDTGTGAQNLAGDRIATLSFLRNYQGLIVRQGITSFAHRQFRVLRAGGGTQNLVIFEVDLTTSPSLQPVDTIGNRFAITGLGDAPLVDIADRVFFDSTIGQERREMWAVDAVGRLFRLSEPAPSTDTVTATLVTTISTPLQGQFFGLTFDRQSQSFILVSDTGQVLTINDPLAGTAVARKPFRQVARFFGNDPFSINFETPKVRATAYRETNPGAGEFQYVIDGVTNCLLRVLSPNDGLLEEPRFAGCGQLTPSGFPLDGGQRQSLDIAPDAAGGEAFAAFNLAGESRSRLFLIDLETGAGRNLGFIGDATGGRISSITVRAD